MISNSENQNKANRMARLQWTAIILFWTLVTIPFMLFWQIWHFTYLIVGLFLFVGGTIVFFWKTIGKENCDDF
jgi:hypothetical protein